MAKAKSKSKVDLKQVLLAKGEYVAMGVAGLFLAVLLVWGASRWAGAKDPEKMAKDLEQKAQSVHSSIQRPLQEGDSALDEIKLPEWIRKPPNYNPVPVSDFAITGPQFDPIAKPDTKRENPSVLPLGKYQVDLVRTAMMGYDIIPVNENKSNIGVIVTQTKGTQDKKKLEDLGRTIAKRGKQLNTVPRNQPPGGVAGGPGGIGPGGIGPGGMGPGVGGPGGAGGPDAGGEGYNPYNMAGGGTYDSTAQRIEKAIEYVPLDELDAHMAKGKVPATTVIPLRMVMINAEIPYKKQVEEIKRALRLPTNDAAKAWGPIYDGYEVQRRVTRYIPGQKEPEVSDWTDFPFEDRYIDLINARKLADNFEDGYLSYFINYNMALALPLPKLVEELGGYPNIRLDEINKTIQKLKDANRRPVQPSELLKRLGERPPRSELYRPQTGQSTGASQIYGQGLVGGPEFGSDPGMSDTAGGGMPLRPMGGGPMTPGRPFRPGDDGTQAAAPPVEIEHLLLRFIDVDVKPGYTYEYRIKLRMLNPNFGLTKDVANPAYAKVERLESPWTQIAEPITVPAESFLYAIDPSAFRKKIEEEYRDQKELRERLTPRDNQAVVEVVTWMEQVRTDAGGKREPVGAWVVADMPVGRGEYVGRKQYIKLPLWSSEASQYILREVADRILPKNPFGKEITQPKGWLVDFSTKSVLVDFEGGKVTTKTPSGKSVTDEVATELLIVRPDGKLVVKSSAEDEKDENRKKIVEGWDKWVKAVETRKVEAGMGGSNPFERPGGGGSPP